MNIKEMQATISAGRQYAEVTEIEMKVLRDRIAALEAALRPLAMAAKSWHDFHHDDAGYSAVQCDEICKALPAALAALTPAETPATPIGDYTDSIDVAPTLETFVEHCKHGKGEDCPECAAIRAARPKACHEHIRQAVAQSDCVQPTEAEWQDWGRRLMFELEDMATEKIEGKSHGQ